MARPDFPLMSDWLKMNRPRRVRCARKLLLDALQHEEANDTFSLRVTHALKLASEIDLAPAGSDEAKAYLSGGHP